mgnify:CR=1 FL=1
MSSVLVLASSDDGPEPHGCLRSLSDAVGATPDHVVGVAHRPDNAFYDRIADEGWDDVQRSVVAMDGTDSHHRAVETLPVDAKNVPTSVRNRLSAFDGDAVVCFDALSELVEDAGLVRTFRFVNRFAAELRETNDVAHFHFDPDAHDTRTFDALTTVFDAVVHASDDDWRLAWKRDA